MKRAPGGDVSKITAGTRINFMTQSQAENFFHLYAKAFDNFDANAIADMFDIPSMIVTPDGSICFTNKDQLQSNFEKLNSIHKKNSYHHADLRCCEVIYNPGNSLSMVKTRWLFTRNNGTTINEFDMVYLLRKDKGDWKISSAVNPD